MFRRRSSKASAGSPGPRDADPDADPDTDPDTDAFADQVLGFLEPLYATALRLTRSRADAEDLVQDTFVKAFRFSDRYQRGTNLKAWLYTILHNTWRNRVRDASRETVDVDSERVEEAAALPGGPVAFDTPEQIRALAPRIHERAVVTRTMPPANKTRITDEERAMLGRWFLTRAP